MFSHWRNANENKIHYHTPIKHFPSSDRKIGCGEVVNLSLLLLQSWGHENNKSVQPLWGTIWKYVKRTIILYVLTQLLNLEGNVSRKIPEGQNNFAYCNLKISKQNACGVRCGVADLTLRASNKLLGNGSQMLSEDVTAVGQRQRTWFLWARAVSLSSEFVCAGPPHSPNPTGVIERACDDAWTGRGLCYRRRTLDLGDPLCPEGEVTSSVIVACCKHSSLKWPGQWAVNARGEQGGALRAYGSPLPTVPHSFVQVSFQMYPITFYMRRTGC